MSNFNYRELLYRIKNILFIFFLFGCINLIPNFYEQKIIGIVLIWLIIIYVLLMFFFYIKKDNNLNHSIMSNILGAFLYLYVYFIAKKYIATLGLKIDDLYYLINYVTIIIGMVGIIVTNFMALNVKKENKVIN